MFMPGSTGTNKVLGQQSAGIETDKLVGNWIPGTGIVNTDSSTEWGAGVPNYWQNQVSGGNHLRVYNCEAADMVYSSPNHIAPDGTNEYLGPASTNYGGSPFQLITERNWAISIWLRPPSDSPTTGTNGVFSFGANLTYPNLVIEVITSDNYTDQFGTDTYSRLKYNLNGTAGAVRYTTIPDKLFTTPRWFNLTVISTGTQRAPGTYYPSHAAHQAILINGTVVDWWDGDFPSGSQENLYIGASALGGLALNSYLGTGWLIGHVHVYQPDTSNAYDVPCLTVSKARQNYHAIAETYKSISNHRHYGDTSYGKF